MAEHNELGKAGEEAAVNYLIKKGYTIRDRNWYKGHLELDIVAFKDNKLVVVEVKTRRNTAFGTPQESVNRVKIRRIVRAADTYIKMYKIAAPVRFDVIAGVGNAGNFEIEHLEGAFYSPLWR